MSPLFQQLIQEINRLTDELKRLEDEVAHSELQAKENRTRAEESRWDAVHVIELFLICLCKLLSLADDSQYSRKVNVEENYDDDHRYNNNKYMHNVHIQ